MPHSTPSVSASENRTTMLQVNLGIAYDEVVKAVDEVEIPAQAA